MVLSISHNRRTRRGIAPFPRVIRAADVTAVTVAARAPGSLPGAIAATVMSADELRVPS
jgi:hypothetical protein